MVREILAEEFPLCFVPKGQEKRPLAISVGPLLHLMKPEIGRHALGAAIEDYCRGPTYLRNCVEGAPRINLKGEVEGCVTANQAAFAADRMRMFTRGEAAANAQGGGQ